MGVVTLITNGLKFLAGLVGWGKQRDAENNSKPMQANAAAGTAQKTDDKVDSDITAADAGKPSALESDLAE